MPHPEGEAPSTGLVFNHALLLHNMQRKEEVEQQPVDQLSHEELLWKVQGFPTTPSSVEGVSGRLSSA